MTTYFNIYLLTNAQFVHCCIVPIVSLPSLPYLLIEEPEAVCEEVANVREIEECERNSNQGVDDCHQPTPRSLGCHMTISWKYTCWSILKVVKYWSHVLRCILPFHPLLFNELIWKAFCSPELKEVWRVMFRKAWTSFASSLMQTLMVHQQRAIIAYHSMVLMVH